MAKLGLEARMTIKELARRGVSRCRIARTLGVSEGTVRYHLRRQAENATDGRSRQVRRAASLGPQIADWMAAADDRDDPLNLADLHDWLVVEHGYEGSRRSVQRYVAATYPKPRRRARRRVETPPGAQAQADWATWRGVMIGGESVDLLGFLLQLSHSRFDALVWSRRKDQLAWLHVHNEAFRRLEGIPATVRVDNEKTAVSRGAGAWGEINPAYRRYAETVRFHVDPCPPRSPESKGKIERRVRDRRRYSSPYGRHWDSLEELQSWTDERGLHAAQRRICPATGTTAVEAWQLEREALGELPVLPEPFDIAVTRTVAADCTVSFEGRTYSVPFALVGGRVEVRGCAGRVQVLHGTRIVADHERHTAERIVLDPSHFDGPSTDTIVAPTPMGKMGKRLMEIGAMVPEQRPIDLYAALAEVAR